jgi:hypothetical protein
VNKQHVFRYGKLFLLCVLGAGANIVLNALCFNILKIPLFLDTVFSAAVTFTAGLLPGLVTVVLTHVGIGTRDGSFTPFIICAIAEVFLVWRMSPISASSRRLKRKDPRLPELPADSYSTFINTFTKLFLLYITTCLAVSILRGIIDFIYHNVLAIEKRYFSSEDTFKISLLRRGLHVLVVDIFSRIPINIVDRSIVIFGGFFISLGLKQFFKEQRN